MKKTDVANTNQTCVHLYDNCFSVDRKKWGTFTSYDVEGKALVTSMTEELCVAATRSYLQWQQEGFTGVASSYTSVVEGKL